MKLALLALPGLDRSLLPDGASDGLPNLSRLAEESARGPLRGTLPPEPMPAWSALATSQAPGRTGIVGARLRASKPTRMGHQRAYEHGIVVGSRELDGRTFWEQAAQTGHHPALVGVPATFPLPDIEATIVAGSPARSKQARWTKPASLAGGLEDESGGYPLTPRTGATPSETIENLHEAIDARFAAADHVARTCTWDLFSLVAPELREAQRVAWSTHDPEHPLHEPGREAEVQAVLEHLDERLGDLLAALGEDATIALVSEHGATCCEGSLRLNAWLAREGYLTLASDAPTEGFEVEHVDWGSTQAWATGGPLGRIHLNVAGREPQGSVDPLDVEGLRDELADAIASMDLGEGVPRVLKPRQVHEGPRVDLGPDLWVDARPAGLRCTAASGEELVAPPSQGHQALPTDEGVFGLRDPEQRYAGEIEGMDVLDVAPTVLDLLDVGVPDAMDGRVLAPDGSLEDA